MGFCLEVMLSLLISHREGLANVQIVFILHKSPGIVLHTMNIKIRCQQYSAQEGRGVGRNRALPASRLPGKPPVPPKFVAQGQNEKQDRRRKILIPHQESFGEQNGDCTAAAPRAREPKNGQRREEQWDHCEHMNFIEVVEIDRQHDPPSGHHPSDRRRKQPPHQREHEQRQRHDNHHPVHDKDGIRVA